jgi:hypothetical protein
MFDNAWFMGADLRTKPAKRDALEIAEAGALYPARRTSVARENGRHRPANSIHVKTWRGAKRLLESISGDRVCRETGRSALGFRRSLSLP